MSQPLARSPSKPAGGIRMTGGTLRTVHDTAGSVLLRFPHHTGVLLLLVFAALTWAAFQFIPGGMRWLFGPMFGFFTLVIGVGALWREELELDFAAGQWRQRRGFVWSGARETRGTLAEIPEVELVLDRRSSSEDSSPTWMVRIQAPAWPSAITVVTSTKEEEGYAELEKWAKRLRKDAVDRTGAAETRTVWDALDQPLGRRDLATAALADAYAKPAAKPSEHPPAGSRIVVTAEAGRRRIVLPPVGLGAGVAVMTLFGLVFGGMGLLFALVSSTLIPNVRVNGEIPTSPVWPMVAMGSFFFLIGLAIMVLPAVGARTREWIEDGADALVIGYSGIGLTWGVKRLPKRTIEGVDLSASPSSGTAEDPHDLRIRTDAKVLRLGRYLSMEELRWLRDRVETMVRG